MEKVGLNQKYARNIIGKCSSLKTMSPLSSKNEIKKRHNSIINKFKFSEDFEKKTNYKKENKTNLKKANSKIINIISNCMEKIQDEKSASSITPHLAELMEQNQYLKQQRKKNKKQVTFNDNNKSQKSKNSLNIHKSNINRHFINNKILFSENLNNKNIIKHHFHRIRTTSQILKEKENEIIYNISSSFMSLYKSKQNFNIFYDKNKLKNLQQKRNSYCFMFSNKKKNNSKRNSKEYKYQTSLANDSQIIKKNAKLKKFPTFIKPNPNNSKIKPKKNRNHKNSISYKSINESLFHNKIELFNFNQNSMKKRGKYNTKINNSILNWTNDLKNKENLTEGEYVHIQQDIKESLIHFNKKELEEEMDNIENTETTNLVKRLPTMKKNNSKSSERNMLLNLLNLKFNNKELNSKNNKLFDKEKYRLLQHTGYVYDSLDDEEVEDVIDIDKYYINPNSIYIFIFDSIIVIISFFCLFYLPYYLASDTFIIIEYLNIKTIVFYIIDIFYILDLIISFFRAYYNYDEILISNIFDMSSHYISNWFLIDFLAAIPFNSIIIFYERKDFNKLLNNSSFTYFGVKINKIYYLLVINKLLKIFKCFSDNNRAFNKFLIKLNKNDLIEEKSGLFLTIFILLSVCNFGTCIFIFIGRNSYPSWLNTIKIEEKSFKSIYICSLYYLITTITTVGYGDIYGRTIQEIVFQIILLMIGTCTYSYLISSVSNFIQKKNEKSLIFENKLKILKEIKLTNPHMKDNLYDKLLRFLRYKKNTEKNQQNTIINSLPYSLRNSLIIEMYKPIINNFIIFKGLENSNCIVQLVTAFKPIYAIRNDILIQEGDFIEEVIFVKTGVITLEIEIDLNKPKESIIQYLNRNNQKDKTFHNRTSFNTFGTNNSINSSMNTSSFLLNHKTTVKTGKKDIKNTHYLKVLDIRKNEHFGETLMFLNERTFLTVKVRSKTAELFFLKKEEVIKIFNIFPNIWIRINKRSIYNMKQIKKIVNKVLLNFCSLIGININDICINEGQKKARISALKNKIQKKKKKLDNNNNKINEMKKKCEYENNIMKEKTKLDNNSNKISEFSLSIIKSESSLTEEKKQNNIKKEENQNKLNITYKDILKIPNKNNIFFNLDKSSNELLSYNSKDNSIRLDINQINQKSTQISHNINTINSHKLKNIYSNSNEFNEFQNKNNINNNISGIKDSKEEDHIKFSSSNLSINIEQKKGRNKNNYQNNENSSKETVKIPMNKKICSLIDSESLEEKNLYDFKFDNFDINNEIYNNEKFNLNCDYEEDDLLNNNKIINSYLNNKIKIEDLSKKILEKTWVKNLDKEKVYYLEKILNKSKDKFTKELNIDSQDGSMFNSSSCISWLLNITNNESFEIKAIYENINDITNSKYNKNISLQNKTKEFLLKECSYENENKKSECKLSSDYNFKKKEFKKMNKTDIILKKKSEKSENKKKYNIRGTITNFRSDNNNYIKKYKISDKKLNILKNNSNNLLPYFHKIKKNRLGNYINKQDKTNKSFRLTDEKEMSFYDKYNLSNLSNLNLGDSEERPSLKKKKKHASELDVINYTIKQDAQNLNQPSLYYQKLFLNQIQKRKEYNQTFLPNESNKNVNNLSLNLKLRRISTSRDINNINNKLSISLKRNNQKSCLNISSKLKKL